MRGRIAGVVVILAAVPAACGSADVAPIDAVTAGGAPTEVVPTHPDIIDARARRQPDGSWRFDVTVSSPYDTADRYADAWRILDPDGNVLGVRELAHHHAGEQPFTRSLTGVDIADDIGLVTIEGRDLLNGWGGTTFDLVLERSG